MPFGRPNFEDSFLIVGQPNLLTRFKAHKLNSFPLSQFDLFVRLRPVLGIRVFGSDRFSFRVIRDGMPNIFWIRTVRFGSDFYFVIKSEIEPYYK